MLDLLTRCSSRNGMAVARVDTKSKWKIALSIVESQPSQCELLRDFVLCNVTSNISDRSDGRGTKIPTIRAKFISDAVKTPRYQRVERRERGEEIESDRRRRRESARRTRQPGSLRSVFYDRIDYPRLCTWVSSPTNVCRTRAVSRSPLHGLSETARGFSYGPFLYPRFLCCVLAVRRTGGGCRSNLNPSSSVHREFSNICRTWNRRSELDADKWLIFLSRRYTPPVANLDFELPFMGWAADGTNTTQWE